MYRLVVYGDHDPLMEFTYETRAEAEEAKEMMWFDIIEEDEEDEYED